MSSNENTNEQIEKEPYLKYKKLKGDLEGICITNTLTAASFHKRHYAVGCNNGSVIILDTNNKIIRKFDNHISAITAIDFDLTGEYILTGDEKGKVCLCTITNADKTFHEYHSPITALLLDKDMLRKRDRCFYVGTQSGHIYINKKGLFGTKDKEIPNDNEGTIYCIEKRGFFLSWINNVCCRLYRLDTESPLNYMSRPENSPDMKDIHPYLYWRDDYHMYASWGCVLKELSIKPVTKPNGTVTYETLVDSINKHSYWINGISHFSDDNIYIFSYPDPTNIQVDCDVPQSLLIDIKTDTTIEGNTIELDNCESLTALDYHLYTRREIDQFNQQISSVYILAPHTIIRVYMRTPTDHMNWYIEQHLYTCAIQVAEDPSNHIPESTVTSIQYDHLQYLLQKGLFEDAASLLPKYIGNNEDLWSQWIAIFTSYQQLTTLSNTIPIHNPRLAQPIYTLILCHFMIYTPKEFLRLLYKWPKASIENASHNLYDVEFLLKRVDDVSLSSNMNPSFIEAKAEIYIMNGLYEKAITLYLDTGIQGQETEPLFRLIEQYHLYNTVKYKVLPLIRLNDEYAYSMLIRHTNEFNPITVGEQLESSPELYVTYLNKLFMYNTIEYNTSDYSTLQKTHLSLLINYCPEKLLEFLKVATNYDIVEAKRLCSEHNPPLNREIVYLLGRMGNVQEALRTIVYELGDAEYALSFVDEYREQNLWNDLVEMSYMKPEFVSALLDKMSDYIDALVLIDKIPNKMIIPNLKEKVSHLLENYNLEVELREGCNQILLSDLTTLCKDFCDARHLGILLDPLQSCFLCGKTIFTYKHENRRRVANDVIAFMCKHIYHEDCLCEHISTFDPEDPQYAVMPTFCCPICNGGQQEVPDDMFLEFEAFSDDDE
ncbi:hypothetical protein WA158_007555 [Blastocystis sp. Blastoise]